MASPVAAQDVLTVAWQESALLLHGLRASLTGDDAALQALNKRSPDLPRDIPAAVLFAVGFFILTWGIRLILVEPFVTQILKMRRAKARKFAQSVMEALTYSGFTYLGVFVVPNQIWVWPSILWWKGSGDGGHLIIRDDLRCYYLMYMARYIQMCFSVLLEPKRKDFLEMLLHHFVTVIVIFSSYIYGWNRVGVVTMLLLDPADVPLHLAKVCKYTHEVTHKRMWQTCADRFFELFAVSFFVTRLVMYSYVVWSAMIEGYHNIPVPGIQGWACLFMLITLWCLQVYWFGLVLKVAVRLMKGTAVEDVRSDDEDVNAAVEESSSSSSQLLYSVPVVAVFLRQVWEATTLQSGLGGVLAEVKELLAGLGVAVLQGSQAAASLPQGPPDLPRDCGVFVLFTIGLFVLNWGLRLLLVEPLTRVVLRISHPQLAKFAQSAMEALTYGSFAVIGLRVVQSQEWVWPSSKWWVDFSAGGHEIMRTDLRCFYILYISRYYQAILSVLLEAKRKDFVEMIVHHVVTVVVIYISYLHGWNRVGVVVMVLLDPADVPLHLAKLCKYTAEATEGRKWQFIADRLFEVFAIVFFITRFVLYGYVCWSAHIEASYYFPKGLPEWTCVGLLYTLLVLQIYWFFLIIKVAVRLLTGQSADDPRSDDEDDGAKAKKEK